MKPSSYQGKLILITGGSSGIGRSLAEDLTKSGAHVFIIARHEEQLKLVVTDLDPLRINEYQRIGYICADVSEENDITTKVQKFIDEEGVPDYLFNSAGISRPGVFKDLDNEIFRQMINVNYLGTVYTTKAVINGMIKRGSGHIVNISSVTGFLGVYGYTAYGASKFAVRGLSESLRYEMKLRGIKVSVVYPPDTLTPQLEGDAPYTPLITKELSGSKPLTSKQVSQSILKGVAHGAYTITPGFDSFFYYLLDSFLGNFEYPIIDFMIWMARRKIIRLQKRKN
jgi:3-dehydrosphinganine reductase